MSNERKISTRENIKVVTANNFIMARGLEDLSLKARKLFYLAIAQCRKEDKEFFEYKIKVSSFAELMGISATHVYEEADNITDELLRLIIKADFGKGFDKYNAFYSCKYIDASGEEEDKGCIIFQIHPKMADAFLGQEKDFMQPLLDDFVRMNSPYSMAVWHLMQRKMHSRKPKANEIIQFDLSLEELREVTKTQDKFKQVGQFKEKILDKAIREIADLCLVNITYTNIKDGRAVVGFRFNAVSWCYIDENKMSQEGKDRLRRVNLKIKAKKEGLTKEEQEELDELVYRFGY